VVLASIQGVRNQARIAATQEFEHQVNTQLVLDQQMQMTFSGSLQDSWGDYFVEGGTPSWVSYSEDVPYGGGQSLVFSNNAFRITGDDTIPPNGWSATRKGIDVSESSYAVSFWFKTTGEDNGMYSQVSDGGGHDRHIYLDGGSICARVYSGARACSAEGGFADGRWHHLLHTYGDSINGQSVWVDGELIAEGSKDHSDFDGQNRARIGGSNDANSRRFSGKMFNFRIYKGTFNPNSQ